MSSNGQSRAAQIKAKHRREVTLPSGNTYLIRKLTNRDYLEEGVLRILVNTADDLDAREPAIREFYDKKKSEGLERMIAQEDRILRKAVIDPAIGDDPDGFTIADLADDRLPLLAAISEFAGLGTGPEAESKKSVDAGMAGGERPASGPDGGALREDAIGVS